ncbi:MAG: C-GCAxxG-C-C family protein [Thermodesulfobacteriota bacterium]
MAVGQEKVNDRNEALIKAMGALGGGVASSGRVCGTLLGGVSFISSLYSRGNLEEKEHPRMWRLSYKLTKKFEELTKPYGGVDCSDIARVNWSDKEQTKEFYNSPEGRRQICLELVGDTAYALGEILDQADAETK